MFHHAPRQLQRVRDAVLDRTPFLQKAVGETSPGEIIAQIGAIDEAEQMEGASDELDAVEQRFAAAGRTAR